jgi:hypothetical protein
MANRFTAGRQSIAACDVCGFRYKLRDLKNLVVKTKRVSIKACPSCWVPDQPQLQLGMYPVADPQALLQPRPDFSGYAQSRSALVPVYNFLDVNEYTSAGGEVGNVTVVLPPPVPTDPYYAYVSLLLHMDGTNGSTTFTDNSPSPKTVTANSGAQVNTSIVKFGTGSSFFSSGFSYLSTPGSSDFEFGTGDFTIEAWAFTAYTGQYQYIVDILYSSSINLQVRYGDFGFNYKLQVAVNKSSVSTVWSCAISQSDAAGNWNHIAFTRQSGVCRLFVNGVLQSLGNGAYPSSFPVTSFTDTTSVSSVVSVRAGEGLERYIDDLRITKGIARYTANFTPPTAAFPNS